MGDEELQIRMTGEKCDDAANVARVLGATDDLFRAVAEEMGLPDVGLEVRGFNLVCDGCDRRKDKADEDWIRRDGRDYCSTCRHQSMVPRA